MMRSICLSVLILCIGVLQAQVPFFPSLASKTRNFSTQKGYFTFHWDATEGKIYMEVPRLNEEFLYVNSLATGVGSNDIGLDRGQLGRERVVYFQKVGAKLLLIQPNYDYRAISDNPDEVAAVDQAFAHSVLGSFNIEAATIDLKRYLIDLTPFVMQDAHGVAERLSRSGQGSYNLDRNRSAMYLPRTKNFPENTEFEVTLTFSGKPKGGYIRSVTPSPEAVSVRQHHSFVKLPDDAYNPRVFDPRAGYFPLSFKDYATPISQPLVRHFIQRHRLEKKDPSAEISEAVEPIVYYLDRGAPEPIRSALLEGARWWNQAFEAAGYKDAFRVEMLPERADPLDVRYNLIQWVHRSTRGWSYGSSVTDPRTGEIIKGHVSLGSLRVRQDFLLAQGLVEAYANGAIADPRVEAMALARLRQLSAHEVGHTLGLSHNYIASTLDRSSVMDYPHPFIRLDSGEVVLDDAYDVGIGEWDKRAILYGYQDFAEGVNEEEALLAILAENEEIGQIFLSDAEARPKGSAHPETHLWDNGEDAVTELMRLIDLRSHALTHLSENNIAPHMPLATLEDVLVPIYFMHRYQAEATAKVIGGRHYRYQVKGDNQPAPSWVPASQQQAALLVLLQTLTPDFLAIPSQLVQLIPPRPIGYPRGREHFKVKTAFTVDPLGAAEASAAMTLGLILHPHRANRLVEYAALDATQWSLGEMQQTLVEEIWPDGALPAEGQAYRFVVQKVLVKELIKLAMHPESSLQTQAMSRMTLRLLLGDHIVPELNSTAKVNLDKMAHLQWCEDMVNLFFDHPERLEVPPSPELPDGSPIGCGE